MIGDRHSQMISAISLVSTAKQGFESAVLAPLFKRRVIMTGTPVANPTKFELMGTSKNSSCR